MIAWKKLTARSTATTFTEDDMGRSGGQPDMTGLILDATNAAITLQLPPAAGCEGRILYIVTVNPSSRTITIDPDGSETIVMVSASASTIANTTDRGQVMLLCEGSKWYAFGDGSFT